MRMRFVLPACLALVACAGGESGREVDGVRADAGVDLEGKVLRIGALNDESGPGAVIGRPYAAGKRMLVAQVNAGDGGLLPDGWTIELIERDHGYNPQQSVQAYAEIKDDVLFIGTSFGTPNTLPLRPMLERDRLVAFPASLSSQMAEHELTPPLSTSYKHEAMRGMDWAVMHAGGADRVRAAVIYQQDDYGQDGLEGWRLAAERHGVALVSEQAIAPGQTDFTAVISTLRSAGANYVLLTVLPSASGPALGTAAQLGYTPVWIGNTPAWIDRFWDASVIPPAVFATYHQLLSLSFWGEEGAPMSAFLATYDRFGRALNPPDFYVMVSYLQGRVGLEAFRRALDRGDVTREGYLNALHTLVDVDVGGILPPVSFVEAPYEPSVQSRVLTPDFDAGRWREVAPAAVPSALAPQP